MKIDVYTADYCQSCTFYKPIFAKVMNDTNTPFEFIDADADRVRTTNDGVTSLPTTIVRGSNGEELYRAVGARPYTEIVDMVNVFRGK